MDLRLAQNERQVRERAYFIWEGEGREFGRAEAHWLQAEAELSRPAAPAMAEAVVVPSPAKVLKPRAKAPAKVALSEVAQAPAKQTEAGKPEAKPAAKKAAAPKAKPAAKADAAAPKAKGAAAKARAPRATAPTAGIALH